MVNPRDCYVKDPEVVTRKIAGETIIVPMKHTVEDLKAIFTLNEMASLVWGRIDGRTTAGELVSSIYREYCVAPETVVKDVVNVLTFLENSGLVRLNQPVNCAEEAA
jgi:hypothetical protein